jgi:hypothetical protein
MNRARLLRSGMPAVLLLSGGCTGWTPYRTSGSTAAQEVPLPSPLRATRQDSIRVVLTAARLRADTLHGEWGEQSLAIPMDQIAGLERKHVSGDRTVGLVGGIGLALGLLYVIGCGESQCQPDY